MLVGYGRYRHDCRRSQAEEDQRYLKGHLAAATLCGMRLAPGTRLGTYEILGPLGAGGMGEVYRAKDLRLGREIAIKVLPVDLASSADSLARFEREARTVAGLNHPNIVTLFSVEDEDGIRFLTMELVDGQPLSSVIAPGGLPVPRVLELSIPLADALAAAHERGVIHRDLKPGNVMVTRDGRVKVLDFGLAKMVAREDSALLRNATATQELPISREGEVQGTIQYMAPEQLRGEAVDARSDLFALGIILCELTTGMRPFRGATAVDIASSILRDTPEPLRRLRTDIPGDLEQIVNRCLEKTSAQRAQSALDISNALRVVQRTLERGALENVSREGVASIAVLPFVNRSRDEDDEYFSDGLADELLHVLANIRGLRVAARTSAFHFKGKDATIGEIGAALHVATILEGSVRKAAGRVRISVQLVKVSDGYHLWSETYDRTLDDILAVQDDIAQSVVRELRAPLLGDAALKASSEVKAEVSKAARGRATNPEAHRLYLQARYFIGRDTREDIARAIEYLKHALELEPEFAHAWATLAWAYAEEVNYAWVARAEGSARAHQAVERALELEPDLAEAHATKGWIQMNHGWNWRGAEASFRRALELAPADAAILRRAGVLASTQNRIQDAITLYRRALELDPLDAHGYNNLGLALHAGHHEVEAEAAYRKALELAPQKIITRAALSLVLLAQGRGEEALAEAAREPDEAFRLWALTMVQHGLGHRAESDDAHRKLSKQFADLSAFLIAEVHAMRGEADAAFAWLEKAHTQRDTGLSEVQWSPEFSGLHEDPRWSAFVKKMGFEE